MRLKRAIHTDIDFTLDFTPLILIVDLSSPSNANETRL